MRILSYSPSFEVYVATSGDSVRYYDLSKDAISCSVSRIQDGASSCSVRLLNENGKYNGKISSMDRITIFASKRERRYQVFTGYITSVPSFTLYPEDYRVSAMCSIYQLQKMYWDPGLLESSKLISQSNPWRSYDANASDVASLLIENVAGWQPERIMIQPRIPQSVEDFARDLYAAQKTDLGNLQDMIKQFNSMLNSTNVMTGAGYATASAGGKDGGGGRASKSGSPLLWPSDVDTCGDYAGHGGIDIQPSEGSPVYSSADGVVTWVQTGYSNAQGSNGMESYGNMVSIFHEGPNIGTVYAHMSEVMVSKGQQVRMGEQIGKCGNTGNSYGAHIHFEIWEGGGSYGYSPQGSRMYDCWRNMDRYFDMSKGVTH